MAVEVISKKKGARTCEAGHEVPEGATECPDCGSTVIKKSLLLIRKAVGDDNDDLDSAVTADDVNDEDDDDLEDEDDDEVEDEDDDDEEEDEDDDDEEDEVVERPKKSIKKSNRETFALEVLNISTALAEDIVKAFTAGGDYETVMSEFNDVMDAAAENWASGKTVSKKSDAEGAKTLINERVSAITKGIEMPSSITKRDDLPEDVRKSLEKADKLIEKSEVERWEGVAKGYSHFPGDKTELAKTLRKLNDADPEAFEELKKTLDAAEENLKQSDVFKRYGSNAPSTDVSKHHSKAAELVAKGDYATIEQAEVALMDGADYTPTNVG
jgi:hypothetical protein